MSSHAATIETVPHVGEGAKGLGIKFMIAGLVVTALAALLGFQKDDKFQHFSYAYLVGTMFVLTIGLGGLFFCILQHLTKSGWSALVRRIAEIAASSIKLSALLFVPLLVPVILNYHEVWWWTSAKDAAADPLVNLKVGYLNTPFFVARAVLYFALWIFMARTLVNNSIKQDTSGDVELTNSSQSKAPIFMLVFALSVTFAAFDFLMSLDPHWFSTIFGVYIFAGCALGIFSTMAIVVAIMRAKDPNYAKLVTPEHTHDIGKFMFGFTFFWGYIAFSQFLLIWYADIPEETVWFERRGANTDFPNAWSSWTVALLFGQFLLAFPMLLSRHVKRNPKILAMLAVWVLVFHLVDLFWIIRPEMGSHAAHLAAMESGNHHEPHVNFHALDVLAPIGVILIGIGFGIRSFAGLPAVAHRDPRVSEALAHVNQ